jgi:hypothetical protein
LCDLPVRIEGTLLERRVRRLNRELQAHNIAALPQVYLSEEFFSPESAESWNSSFAVTLNYATPTSLRA